MFNFNLIGNYITTGVRALTRHKMHLGLNIFGLSIGLSAVLLVSIFTAHEISYDENQPNGDRVYRILEKHIPSGRVYSLNSPHAFQYYNKIAGVEDYVGLLMGSWLINHNVIVDNITLELDKVFPATESLLDFVDFDVLHGDMNAALVEPDTISISESEAIRFFGEVDVVGRKLTSKSTNWTVGAVFADLPTNTHFDIKTVISAEFAVGIKGKIAYTYVRLAEGADVEEVSKSISEVMANIWTDDKDMEQILQPITDIHLAPNLNEEMKVGGSQLSVNISIALSILLIVIASFNTINMSIARAGQRANEVGIRKTLGAVKSQLIGQFLVESVLVSLVSGLIALGIAEFFLADFNLLIGRQLEIEYWGISGALLASFIFVVGIVSGLYPALFMSSFNAKRVLSGDLERGKTALIVRKILLVVQSALSICFIIVSFSIYQQLNYLQDFPVNYEKSNRLRVADIPEGKIFYHEDLKDEKLEKSLRTGTRLLFQDLVKIDGVISATPADIDLTRGVTAGVRDFTIIGANDFVHNMGFSATGYNAAKTLGLNIIAGRDFNQQSDWYDRSDKSVAIMIPESALALSGFQNADDAIGKVGMFTAGQLQNIQGRIIGVFKDVKIGSVKDEGFPIMFACGLSWGHQTSMVIEVEQDNTLVREQISEFFRARLGIFPIEIESIESSYKLLYKEDGRLAVLVLVFSVLIVFLTCVGMFGLSAFTVNRRRKEIAIRKVLGASRNSLIVLLAKEYILLNIISMIISFPIAFYLVVDWLQGFNEKFDQSIFLYVASGLFVTLLTALTISIIAFWAASTKPSKTLRQN